MYVSKVSPKSNLVPRVLSYPPSGARERETGHSLSRSRGRVGENPGNEVAQKAVCTQQAHFWGPLRTGLVFQNKSFHGGNDGPLERSISHSHPSKDGRFSNGGRGGGVRIFFQRSRQNLDASDKFLRGDDTVSTHLHVVRHHLRNY